MGEGPDHGLYDVYIGGSLWQSFNGYAASAGERVIPIPLSNDGPFTLQVNNRADRGSASSGHVMRFKQLSVDAEYTLQTIGYTYDAASRVLDAEYYPGEDTASTPAQTFAYEYDVAGNLTDNNGTARTFNKLNQISSGSVMYDANGNMTGDGANAYTWDRANRLLTKGGHEYTYDGMGNRVSQSVSSVVTEYLLDVQPGLVQTIAANVDSSTEYYVHAIRGIHASEDASNDWYHLVQDGLGSVRAELENNLGIDATGQYEPYGSFADVLGTFKQPFRFTGEMSDTNSLQYHRARYYSPASGNFTSLDMYEGNSNAPYSLNLYSYVRGNVTNLIDVSGRCPESTMEIGRTASRVMKGAFLDLARFDGAVDELVAQSLCAAQDAAPAIAPIVASGTTFTAAATVTTGLSASVVVQAAAAGGLLGLFGVGLFLTLAWSPMYPYTPEQLMDMRPPTPSPSTDPIGTPNPNTAPNPQTFPFPQIPCPPPQLKEKEKEEPGECDQATSLFGAALDYANTARLYHNVAWEYVGVEDFHVAFAVTRAKHLVTGACNEVVGMNDNVADQENHQLWREAYAAATIAAASRGATLAAGSGQPTTSGEHAEYNLINAVEYGLYDPNTFRAMGISQVPCRYAPHNCQLRLRQYLLEHPGFQIAYFDWRHTHVPVPWP